MFESTQLPRSARRRWLSLPIAVGLHGVALVSFTFAGYWHVESLPAPPTNDVLFVSLPPPEPPPPLKKGGGTPPVPTHKQAPAQKPPEAAQPKDTPDQLPPPEATPAPGSQTVAPPGPGVPDGDDVNGDPKGIRGGIPNQHGTTPGAVPNDGMKKPEPILQVGGAVTQPVLISGPQPRYTELARRAGVQGTVKVEAVIDEQGRVNGVRVINELRMGLDQAAVDAIRTWRFQPATLAGRPVKVYYTLTVNFHLEH